MCRTWLHHLGSQSLAKISKHIRQTVVVVAKSSVIRYRSFFDRKCLILSVSTRLWGQLTECIQLLSHPCRLTLWRLPKGLDLALFRPGTMHLDRSIRVQYERAFFPIAFKYKMLVVTTGLRGSAIPGRVTLFTHIFLFTVIPLTHNATHLFLGRTVG